MSALLSRGGNPKTYTELQEKLRQINNNLRYLSAHSYYSKATLSSSSSTARSHTPRTTPTAAATVSVQPPSTATGTHAGPIDVSVARGPLLADEKSRRRANGLYLYCGQPGHQAKNCPNGNKQKHLRVAETNIIAASPSPSPSSPAESENGVSLN